MASVGHSFLVIGCSETGPNDISHVDILNLEDYKSRDRNRLGRSGGAVAADAAAAAAGGDGGGDGVILSVDSRNLINILS